MTKFNRMSIHYFGLAMIIASILFFFISGKSFADDRNKSIAAHVAMVDLGVTTCGTMLVVDKKIMKEIRAYWEEVLLGEEAPRLKKQYQEALKTYGASFELKNGLTLERHCQTVLMLEQFNLGLSSPFTKVRRMDGSLWPQ